MVNTATDPWRNIKLMYQVLTEGVFKIGSWFINVIWIRSWHYYASFCLNENLLAPLKVNDVLNGANNSVLYHEADLRMRNHL
jgi:hypothetical protein